MYVCYLCMYARMVCMYVCYVGISHNLLMCVIVGMFRMYARMCVSVMYVGVTCASVFVAMYVCNVCMYVMCARNIRYIHNRTYVHNQA